MNPQFKPYLLRAFYEWVMDQGWTPHLSVIVDEHTHVPVAYVKDGRIVLNVGANACRNFFIHNDGISFEARFNGVVHNIWVPAERVESIFAREADEGIIFEVLPSVPPKKDTPPLPSHKTALHAVETVATKKSDIPSATSSKRPSLKVVK